MAGRKKIDPIELTHAPDALPGGLKCVFSQKQTIKIGAGVTKKRHSVDIYWYVEQLGPEAFCMWSVGPQGVPVGERKKIDKQQLLSDFYPELHYYNEKVAPKLQQLLLAVARGDNHREKEEHVDAAEQYEGALAFDEGNVRAVFGLGISSLSMGDLERARHIFSDLITLKAAFTPEYKHLFNEMAINLRKSGMYTEAVGLYERAMELTREDENLLFNISRVYFESGDWSGCVDFLERCLTLNPTHRSALSMTQLLLKIADDAELQGKYGLPKPTPEQVRHAARLRDM